MPTINFHIDSMDTPSVLSVQSWAVPRENDTVQINQHQYVVLEVVWIFDTTNPNHTFVDVRIKRNTLEY